MIQIKCCVISEPNIAVSAIFLNDLMKSWLGYPFC